ncbi:MAG: hypothetical protein NC548_12760 [Lachnospiraceae bacterium]|nr:hypothetical protein [Lachnospiraceae bacterium]MCM1230739.1 hypothetical protein [Ruminococcus flavefaciens]
MLLEFENGFQLQVDNIIGGPRLVSGVLRDTLRIEVYPNVMEFQDLKSLFENNGGTFYTIEEVDGELRKALIGEGYTVFVSISDEKRKIGNPPGRLLPDRYEEIYAVTIAQETYQEHLLKTMSSE